MLILPAIDLMEGAAVRLRQGDFSRATRFSGDPVAVARQFADAGAEWLHIVDLDGARSGESVNRGVIEQIADLPDLKVQTGGGVRSIEDIADRLEAGAARVVIGTLLVSHPEDAAAIAERFGADRLVAALDVRPADGKYRIALRGWQEDSAAGLTDMVDILSDAGLRHFLVTDIARDGMMQGPNVSLYRDLAARYPGLAFQASGGIRERDDLDRVAEAGAEAAIVGRALYEGGIALPELFNGG